MPAPTRLREFPLGVIRGAVGPGRCAFLVDTGLFVHAEIAKLRNSLPAGQQNRRYWVFALPRAALDTTGRAFTLSPPAPAAVKAFGFDDFDAATNKYAELANTEAGKPNVPRGGRGLQQIGTED